MASQQQQYSTVGQLAVRLGVAPPVLSQLLYTARHVDTTKCVKRCGRRLIPEDLVPAIRAALVEAGHVKEPEAANA